MKYREIEKELILSEVKSRGDVEEQIAKLKELDIKESQQLDDIFKKRGRIFNRVKGA